MKKFLRILLFNLKVETKFKVDYFFRLFMYCFHIVIFNELWDYLLKDKLVLGYDKKSIIWYIIIGEAIIYSMNRNFVKISEIIKNGDIVNILVKPINILEYLFIGEFTSVINLNINLIFAFVFGVVYLGVPQISLVNIFLFVISVIISYFTILFCQLLIGLLAFFFEDNDVFYLIISKAILIVTMSPLDFFDGFVYKFLSVLPTTYIIYGPSKIFLNCDVNMAIKLIVIQLMEFLLLYSIVKITSMKGVEKINVNGG